MQTSFEGIWVPIVTPYVAEDTQRIDHGALARLAQYLVGQGIAGLVAGATTGEGALLAPEEQEAVFATVQASVPGTPIVFGVSQSSTQAAVAQARRLSALRPAGLLVTAPPYVRPSQQGVRRHIEAVVEGADLPVLIYNIPYRTSVNIELDTLQELARDPRVAGIKECGGTPERMLQLVHETPLCVLSGDDNQNFMAMCLGAHGAIAAAAHVLPAWHVRVHDLLRRDHPDLAEARRLAVALQPLIRALFAEPNPAPLKALLAHLGWCQASVREPFVAINAGLQAQLVAEWRALQPVH